MESKSTANLFIQTSFVQLIIIFALISIFFHFISKRNLNTFNYELFFINSIIFAFFTGFNGILFC